uniref:Ion transport domain-containing protein n=1 Tax=Fundulus heteroclitus TaxID=8078 RepID=A0A3Q2QQC2_FUNHE
MTSEECPVPLRRISSAGPGQSEEYCSAHPDDIIEEVGPGDDDISIGSDLSTLVLPFPELAPVVFFCLKQTTCPRNWCIRMVSNLHRNVGLLYSLAWFCFHFLPQAFDAFIYIFFALEMVVKMVALGIFGRRCYLGDTWNRLDFFIVMAGMVEYSLDLQNINLSAIRTVRVLRPLKAINRVPSERILCVFAFLLLLCLFFTLHSCMTLPAPYYRHEEDDERPFICSLASDNGIMSCTDVPARREGGRICCLDKEDALAGEALGLCINWNQYYTRCHTGNSNPHKGAINFDNIVYAWIVIFQVITLEGWVEIMYYVMDAHSFYNFIYFILLIIVSTTDSAELA